MLYIFGYITLFTFLVYLIFSLCQKSLIKNSLKYIEILKFDENFLFKLSIFYVIGLSLFITGIILIISIEKTFIINNDAFLFFILKLSFLFIVIFLSIIFYLIRNALKSILKILLGLTFFYSLGLFFILSSVIGFINHKYDTSKPMSFDVQIIKKTKSSSRAGVIYYLYIKNYKHNELTKIWVSNNIYYKVDELSFITLNTKKGYLGFEYLDSVVLISK